MDSHWINVGLPLDWTSKFDPTNHRTRAPILHYDCSKLECPTPARLGTGAH